MISWQDYIGRNPFVNWSSLDRHRKKNIENVRMISSPRKFTGKGRCGGGDSVVDEEVIVTLPWAWNDDDAVWCGKASTMDVWTASHASGKGGEERLESWRLHRAIVELVPGELARWKFGRGGDVARASVGA